MRPAKVADGAVADALVSAFRRGGYAGAAVSDLCEATGLKSASLYHRFPRGKADMALAALARVGEAFEKAVVAPLEAAGDPAARLAKSALGLRQSIAQDILHIDLRESLEHITVPSLVIVGDRDLVTPKTTAQALRSALPDARAVAISGAGHLSMLERHRVWNEVVGEYLEETLASTGARRSRKAAARS